eukprot:TRINITY_DN6148_c0_g2_i1.p1 TRINITY_DN6148_c0_g2~~TRINITY_DN6148_c0_g2_i1.p1  ORF type:complete len:399 (+),score=57.45 TRINITY_DN6148_c0_g2_i1:94-1197(+)
MPLDPSSKFAVISAYEFANFANGIPGVPEGKDYEKPKKEMQDRHTIIDPWGPHKDMAFLGIYDGHSGSVAAEYCKISLHDILLEEVARVGEVAPFGSLTDVDFAKAFTRAFEQVDANLRSMGVSDGTTATVAVLHHPNPNQPAKVHVANVGDSPAVLFGGTFDNPIAVRASVDHDASDEKERMRVLAAGGKLSKKDGADYVKVPRPGSHRIDDLLQTTRSLGDFVFKDPAVYSSPVIPTPHVYSYSLEGWEIGLMMMSDGVNGSGGGFENDKVLVQATLQELSEIMERDYTFASGQRPIDARFVELQEENELAVNLIWHGYRRRGPTDNMTLVTALFRSFRCESSPARTTSFDQTVLPGAEEKGDKL